MCYSIYRLTSVMKLCQAAHKVQQLIDDGTLAEAFGRNKNGEAHESITAFNLLSESAATVADERKDISPFLRYRREILADTAAGFHLRELVMNLAGGASVDVFALLTVADAPHTRIALECITHAANHPNGDSATIELRDLILANEQPGRIAA